MPSHAFTSRATARAAAGDKVSRGAASARSASVLESRAWCEPLEARQLLALTITFGTTNRTLTLTGTNAADSIVVTHDGRSGGITVSDAGTVVETRSNVAAVIVNGGAGNDLVTYNLVDTVRQSFFFKLRGGDGNDTLTASLLGFDITNSSTLEVSFDGQNGNDTARIVTHTSTNRTNIFSGSILRSDLIGGPGRDDLRFDYQGELDGVLQPQMKGDDGDDVLIAKVVLNAGSTGRINDPDSLTPSTSAIPSLLRGDFDSDILDYRVTDNSGGNALVFARIDGGISLFDNDRGTRTANVSSIFLESDTIVTAFLNRTITHHPRVGQTTIIAGTAFQPNAGRSFFLDVNWGDGTSETFEFPSGEFTSGETRLLINHIYHRKGKYKVDLVWRDDSIIGNSDVFKVHVLP
ncbi:MAG: hypothetical protein ACREJC_09905 [Tepidisphaeraceae bacterium]